MKHVHDVPVADEVIQGDIGDPRALREAVAGSVVVVHLAAVTHARQRDRYQSVNVRGTANLVAAAQETGVQRFVLVSSRAATPAGGHYSSSKLEAERLVVRSTVPFTILRLAEVYGIDGQEGVDRVISLARRGAPIPLVGDGGDEVCPLFVDDAVDAIVAAVDSPAGLGQTYTLGGECMSLAQFVATCTLALHSESRTIKVPEVAVRLAARLSRVLPLPLYPDQLSRLRASKSRPSHEAMTDLRFHPRPLAEGLDQIRTAYPSQT